MNEEEHCCGRCKHLLERTDSWEETYRYCPITGCVDVGADDPPCEFYEEVK